MSQTGNRKLRTLLLSALCLIALQLVVSAPVFAQRRPASNVPPETPSQRWLPLPQGGSADLRQQVQWLRQLKGLVGADALGGEASPLLKFDPEQMKALLAAVKQMSGGLPDGTQSSALDGISPEQISKALADPALREQARRMLEQFTREGKLPQRGGATDPQGVPFPPASTERGRGGNGESPERGRSDSEAGPESSALPPAMQKLLQQLAEQGGRQSNGLPHEPDPATGGSSERESGAADLRNDQDRPSRSTAADQRPAVTQPRGTTPLPGVTPTEGAVERPGASPPDTGERNPGADARRGTPRNNESKSAPYFPPSVSEMLKNGPMLRDQPFQAGSSDPRSGRSNPRPSESRDPNSTSSPTNSRPSMSDASTGGTPSGSRPVDSGNSVPVRPSSQAANRDRESRGAAMPPPPSSNRGPTPLGAHSDTKPPPMDVRSELEQQGFAQTLRKIVEQAREESLVAANDSAGSLAGGQAGGNGSSSGLEGSVVRMLDGLRKGLVESAQEPPAPAPSPTRTPSSATPSSALQPAAERRSPLSRVSQAAGNILSDIATPPASVRSPRATSSSGTADSQGAGSRSTVGLLMLLAVLGLVWYFVPHLLAAINDSRLAGSPVGGAIHPADIRSRSDVVRAFHQYALRPATRASTWWTHREVERQVAESTPTLRPAIQTLTDLYEQARYLPDNANFTPDQIGTARRALEQCQAASS